ncbi:MAG: DUF3489 domain-containing protein [Methylobacterium mesophilicum]|nr:DUF3489 domain-containing protein [Methylobacterium mesophilicum]
MTKLSDTQLIILSRACAREDRAVLPLPETLKGGAVQRVVQSLVNKHLIAEAPAQPGQPRWREDDAGAVTLVATAAAFDAIGADMPLAADTPSDELQEAAPPVTARRTRENTKQAQLVAMLKTGATVDEIAAATGWQKHTVRGAMAGALKKRLGLSITSEKVEGRGRVYRIAD